MKTYKFRSDIDPVVEDPDGEKVPNLIMQFKKSMDIGGTGEIVFMDGTKTELSVAKMIDFLNIYDALKPIDREEMQALAVHSVAAMDDVLLNFKREKAPKSNYI